MAWRWRWSKESNGDGMKRWANDTMTRWRCGDGVTKRWRWGDEAMQTMRWNRWNTGDCAMTRSNGRSRWSIDALEQCTDSDGAIGWWLWSNKASYSSIVSVSKWNFMERYLKFGLNRSLISMLYYHSFVQMPEKRERLGVLLKDLAESTSIHGIPKIATAKPAFQKVLWSILLAAVSAYLCYQLNLLFTAYYKWPLKTSVSLQFNKLQFPAITICNMNPIKKDQLVLAQSNLRTILNPTKVKRYVYDRNNCLIVTYLFVVNDSLQFFQIISGWESYELSYKYCLFQFLWAKIYCFKQF